MKITFAFLADAATITDDGLFDVVGGGFDLLRPKSFPAIKAAMALVGRVVFEVSEIGETYELLGQLIGPDGSTLHEMALSITPFQPPPDLLRANWITICLNYQLVSFPTAGDYFIRLSVANQVLGEVPIEVVPPGGQT